MGAAASIDAMEGGLGASLGDLKEFVSNFAPLAQPGSSAKAVRKQTWLAVDPNGNGLVSLAEFDGWIKKTLLLNAEDPAGQAEADRLWKLYRPSYIRAFNDAKDVSKERPVKSAGDATTDDYVTKGEFRVACAYLCLYASMFDAFNLIDGGSAGTTATDDRRMDKAEWAAGWQKVKDAGYGFVAFAGIDDEASDSTVDSIFDKMDADKKGKVLLNEFCKYIEAAEVKANTMAGRLLAAGEDDAKPAADAAAPAPAADGGGAK